MHNSRTSYGVTKRGVSVEIHSTAVAAVCSRIGYEVSAVTRADR